jgi:hypothetical protein
MKAYAKADEAGIFIVGAQGQPHAPSDRCVDDAPRMQLCKHHHQELAAGFDPRPEWCVSWDTMSWSMATSSVTRSIPGAPVSQPTDLPPAHRCDSSRVHAHRGIWVMGRLHSLRRASMYVHASRPSRSGRGRECIRCSLWPESMEAWTVAVTISLAAALNWGNI